MATNPTPYSQPSRRPGLRGMIVLGAIAFAAGIAIALMLVRYYSGWITPAPQASSGQAAQTGIGAPMFQPPPEADLSPRTPDAAALDARLIALNDRLQQIEVREAAIDLDSRAAAGNAGRAESLLIAFAARRAIDRGLALGYLESQLRTRFGATQPRAVQTIIDAARAPVTVEDLRLSLDTIAPELATGGSQAGWWDSLHREITGLIVIHKEGTPSPHPADRLRRIRRMLDARQVEAALAEVSHLPGATQAGAWIAAAQRFVEAHRALDLIETIAIIGPSMQDPEAAMPQRADQQRALTAPVTTRAPVSKAP